MSLHNVHFLGVADARDARGHPGGRAASFVDDTLRGMREGDEVGRRRADESHRVSASRWP
jgi:hypothetical protein